MIPCYLLDFACLNLDERANSNSFFLEARGKQQWYMARFESVPESLALKLPLFEANDHAAPWGWSILPGIFFWFLCGSRCTLTATSPRYANTQTTSLDVGLRSSSGQRTDRISLRVGQRRKVANRLRADTKMRTLHCLCNLFTPTNLVNVNPWVPFWVMARSTSTSATRQAQDRLRIAPDSPHAQGNG